MSLCCNLCVFVLQPVCVYRTNGYTQVRVCWEEREHWVETFKMLFLARNGGTHTREAEAGGSLPVNCQQHELYSETI